MRRSPLLVVLLAAAGCGAPRPYQWAPDGSKLAIHASKHKLFVTDAEGNRPIEFSVEEDKQELLTPLWHPDSEHLLVTSFAPIKDWNDIEEQLSTFEQKQWAWAAAQVNSELLNYLKQSKEEMTEQNDDRSALEASPTLAALEGFGALMVARYLQAQEPNSIAADYPPKWNDWLQTAEAVIRDEMALYRIDDGRLTKVRVLRDVIGIVLPISVSPSGKYLAYLKYDPFVEESLKLKDEPDSFDLWVMPIDGSDDPRRVATSVVFDPTQFTCAWTRDERELIFFHASYPDRHLGGRIVRAAMPFRQGTNARTGIDGNYDVEGIVQTGERECPLRMLSDGRILFIAKPKVFPQWADDLDSASLLYVLDPNARGPLVPLFEDKLPIELSQALENDDFAVSPAGDKLAVTSKRGVIWLLHLPTGKFETLQPNEYQYKGEQDNCPWYSLPSWKSNDELSFAVPPGSKFGSAKRAEIVLWSRDSVRCLSKDWPEEMVGAWQKKSPSEQGGR
jgi:hypothetical protein